MDSNNITTALQNHLRSSPSFCKLLDEDFSTELIISKESIGKAQEVFNGKRMITVIGPCGRYDVGIRMSQEEIILENGWAQFIQAHQLCNTDQLMFICACHGLFVLIYDKRGKLVRQRSEFSMTEEGGTKHKPGVGNDTKAQYLCKKEFASSSRPNGNKKELSTNSDSSDSETDSQEKYKVKPRTKIFISRRRAVTYKEEKRALEAAQCFESSRPCFHKQMKANNVRQEFTVIVPTKFARENLPHKKCELSLRVPGKTKKWDVNCTLRVQKEGKQHVWTILKGWSEFTLDNNLEINDVLVFEMKKDQTHEQRNNKIKMNVHIFRVVKEITPLRVLNLNSFSTIM